MEFMRIAITLLMIDLRKSLIIAVYYYLKIPKQVRDDVLYQNVY